MSSLPLRLRPAATTLARCRRPAASAVSAVPARSLASQSPVLCVSASRYLQESDPRWLSDAEERIKEVPVIEVEGRLAVCDGGSGALGHPLEYMTLDTVAPGPVVCKYCGLRYQMKQRKNRFGKTMKFEA